MPFAIRKFTEDDWRTFSEIRLLALRTDPGVFASNFDQESQLSEVEWRKQLADTNSAVFGVFDGDTPIGMTAISVDRNDPSKKTAILWGSWLRPDSRGQGLSTILYSARIGWAAAYPNIERIIVSHRASNLFSKAANQKFGFVETNRSERVWPDGKTEHELHYVLTLGKGRP